jgi:ribosomal protein S18 acetylase RimI-like enzyme
MTRARGCKISSSVVRKRLRVIMTPFEYSDHLSRVDWSELKALLTADHFDNGRTPAQLRKSFENSTAAIVARAGDGRIIGTARVLSDGVCNAYLVDVWTYSEFRRLGVARRMIELLLEPLRGQHVYLQADPDNIEFYRKLGFCEQPSGMSRIVGTWLKNG